MATLTVRNIDDELKARLRVQAAANGRSMEAEIRAILRDSLEKTRPRLGLGTRIHERLSGLGLAETELPPRSSAPRAIDLDE